jgi:hypothetical protein
MSFLSEKFAAVRLLFPGASSWKWVIWAAAAVFLFSAGATINGYRWGEKYNAREVVIREWQLEEMKKLEVEWATVQRLQDSYTELNKDTYNDLYQKLSDLGRSVTEYGTRTVRVCSSRPAVVKPVQIVAPSAAAGTDGSPRDGLSRGVEQDTGSGGDPEGYDLFPETNALMVEAQAAAIRCNSLIEWERNLQRQVEAENGK